MRSGELGGVRHRSTSPWPKACLPQRQMTRAGSRHAFKPACRSCNDAAVSKSKPAEAVDVFWTGMRWVDAAFMQIHRFEEAFYDLQTGLLDADMRRRCNQDADSTWRASFDANYEPYDPHRPISVPTF